jgi:DNA replication protein DnaC
MKEFTPCRKCSEGRFPGYILIDGLLNPCNCYKKWHEENIVRVRAQKANIVLPDNYNIDTSYLGTKSIDSVKRLKTFLSKLDSDDQETKDKLLKTTLYFYGPNGTQKTTVANWFGTELIKREYKVKYILMNNLIKLLVDYERSEEAQLEIEKIKKCDAIILDEALDQHKITIYKSSYQIPFLDSFLREVIGNKIILFVSNVNIKDIDENYFSSSIKDLVTRNVLLRKALLEFHDNYFDTASDIDVEDLF